MNEAPKKKKKPRGTVLYAVAAVLIGTVALLAWYAGELNDRLPDKKNSSVSSETESVLSVPADEYDSIAASSAEPVDKAVSDVPYSEPEESAPQTALVWPVSGEINKIFSLETLQYSATFDDMRLHTGVDLAAELNTAVLTCGAGTVTAVDESATLGNCVTVDHGNGILMKYCGLQNIKVAAGQSLAAGDVLGVVGSIPCECADPDHLHLEASLNGTAVSPSDLIGVLP